MQTRFRALIIVTVATLSISSFSTFAAEYAIVGDGGEWNQQTRLVRDSIRATGILDLVMPGDNLYDGDSYDTPWAPWRSYGFRFPVVAIGNHHGGYAQEVAYFNLPGEYYSVQPETGVLFIVLNSNHQKITDEQTEFLERELGNTRATLVFVVFHHPPVTVSPAHDWEERRKFHVATTPVMLKYRDRITALLLGHEHLAAWYDIGGIQTIVSGATHEFRAAPAIDEEQRGLHVRSRYTGQAAPHWVKLNTQVSRATATFEFIRADRRSVACRTRLASPRSRQPSDSHCQNE
jgi:hypothetical protein